MKRESNPPLTVMMAVALHLLDDGFTQEAIVDLTGIPAADLYAAAYAEGIWPGHGTAERAMVDQAAGEDPCGRCQTALGARLARERAAATIADTCRKVTANLRRTGGARRPRQLTGAHG